MGYFSNGSEGCSYEAAYCDKCVHQHPKNGCPCWDAHMLWNYDECNNKESILHKMIQRSEDGLSNTQCSFYVPRDKGESAAGIINKLAAFDPEEFGLLWARKTFAEKKLFEDWLKGMI
jgi:hypothetical protein